jgi:hypothetical protein
MEILAASGSGSRTPAPGRLSFTSVLIRQVRKRLKLGAANPEFTIRWLHKHLFDDRIEFGLTGEGPSRASVQGQMRKEGYVY